MEELRQGITGMRIAPYIEDILTHNYCPYFMRMSIIREDDQYRLIYRPGNLRRLDIRNMDLYSKAILLRTLIDICIRTGNYLIRAENFLLEPELIYTTGGNLNQESIRIMYYPDTKHMDASRKLMQFAERIKGSGKEERELFEQFKRTIETGDINKAGLMLDKNILRLEGRLMSKAG